MPFTALQSMLTLSDDYQPAKTIPAHPDFAGTGSKPLTRSLYSSQVLEHHISSAASHQADSHRTNIRGDQQPALFQTSDIPLLISDREEEDSGSDSDISSTSKTPDAQFSENSGTHVLAAEAVKRSIKEEKAEKSELITASQPLHHNVNEVRPATSQALIVDTLSANDASQPAEASSQEVFKTERGKVMKIIVKYIAMKITNSFPPPSSAEPEEIPLDEYIMILSSRLQLTLPQFMKGIIYLFRYMDIIYLLRYFNQSNNFANYTDMGHGLKKLLIGCFRLVLAKERVSKDWSGITGLSNKEINSIVKTLVGRLNGKLMIKDVELVKLRSEMFRFVKMVTKTV